MYHGYWHFENGATSKIDDVLIEHSGLPSVIPLTVHLTFFGGQVGGSFDGRCRSDMTSVQIHSTGILIVSEITCKEGFVNYT